MSSPSSRPTPPAVIALQAVARARSSQDTPAMQSPAPTSLREPYAVERFPALGGVRLIGYGAEGTPVVELTIQQKRYKSTTMRKLQRWLMAEDNEPTPPSLSVVK